MGLLLNQILHFISGHPRGWFCYPSCCGTSPWVLFYWVPPGSVESSIIIRARESVRDQPHPGAAVVPPFSLDYFLSYPISCVGVVCPLSPIGYARASMQYLATWQQQPSSFPGKFKMYFAFRINTIVGVGVGLCGKREGK